MIYGKAGQNPGKNENQSAGLGGIEDVQSVASRFGVEWNHEGTSHVIFRAPNASKLTIPAKRGIKPVYIRKFVKWIEGLKS